MFRFEKIVMASSVGLVLVLGACGGSGDPDDVPSAEATNVVASPTRVAINEAEEVKLPKSFPESLPLVAGAVIQADEVADGLWRVDVLVDEFKTVQESVGSLVDAGFRLENQTSSQEEQRSFQLRGDDTVISVVVPTGVTTDFVVTYLVSSV